MPSMQAKAIRRSANDLELRGGTDVRRARGGRKEEASVSVSRSARGEGRERVLNSKGGGVGKSG